MIYEMNIAGMLEMYGGWNITDTHGLDTTPLYYSLLTIWPSLAVNT